MGVDEWDAVNLRDVCFKIGSGATPRGGQNVYLSKGEYTLIRSQNIYNEGFSQDGLVFLTKRHAEELSNVEVQKGDVLLNITGDSVARCCQVDERVLPARVNQHVSIIRSDSNKLDSCFLRYFLISLPMQSLMLSWAGSGGTRNALTKGMIEAFEVPCPPIAEQKAIAHILGTLDDKIELNQQMNQTLEAIARALFKSWFIDFDPVRAKLDGRQPIGMDAETAALFPAEFEDSALGEIPKGWKIQTSESIFSVKDGTHDSPKVAEAGYPLVTSRHLKKGYIDFDNTYLISEDDFHEVNKRSKVDKNDVLITMIGTVGNLLFIDYEEVNFAIKNVGLFKTSEKPELSEYFYFYLRSDKIENYLKIRQAGTTQSYITLKTLRTIPVLLPSSELVRLFSKSVTPQLQKITATREESHLLVSIRDALLPKLLSGEIRVQDAETVVEAVT